MADKNFFDLFNEKMSALRPSEKHRNEDWAALGNNLNAVLPQAQRERRRAIVLPFILTTVLLSSNAFWWHSTRNHTSVLTRLENQIMTLQQEVNSLSHNPGQKPANVQHDTLWRTVYISVKEVTSTPADHAGRQVSKNDAALACESGRILEASVEQSNLPVRPVLGNDADAIPANQPDRTSVVLKSAGSLLQLPARAPVLIGYSKISSPSLPCQIYQPISPRKHTEPFPSSLANALRPKFFKLGAGAGWLDALSDGLMHEGGFSCRLIGEIGLSRHWSLSAALGMGMLHYKSNTPNAIMGAPELPVLPTPEHIFTEMDVTGQRIRQFELGLRYTLAQPGKFRPFFCVDWGGQTILPFAIEYEIQHGPTGAIQKGVFDALTKRHMRNIFGIDAGMEIPMSRHINLIMEGFYKRQWKKPDNIAPDLVGIRAGLNWLF